MLDFTRNVVLVDDWFLKEHVQRAFVLGQRMSRDPAKIDININKAQKIKLSIKVLLER